MKTVEYADVTPETRSKVTTIKTAVRGCEYRLVHRSPGWERAGSMARIRENECWSVLFEMNNATHGQSFGTLVEAEKRFTLWTTD